MPCRAARPRNRSRRGNHEIMMLDYIDGKISYTEWMRMGADALLRSYGLDPDHLPLIFPTTSKLDTFIRQSLPKSHIDFMRDMPIDEDLVFIRDRFFYADRSLPKLVVHGHTPVPEPDIQPMRLNLDTRAFKSGSLTVARFWRGQVHIFST